jgi:hypothetical protein
LLSAFIGANLRRGDEVKKGFVSQTDKRAVKKALRRLKKGIV